MRKTDSQGDSGFKTLSWILAAILVLIAGFFIYELYKLNVLPGKLLVPALCILALIAAIIVILQVAFTKGSVAKFLLTLVTVMAIAVYGTGAYYLMKTNSLFSAITSANDETKTTVLVLAMKDNDNITEVGDLNGRTIGFLSSMQAVSNDKMEEALGKEGIKYDVQQYKNIEDMATALYDGKVPAIVLTQTSAQSFQDLAQEMSASVSEADVEEEDVSEEEEAEEAEAKESRFKSFLSDTKAVYTTTYTQKKASTTVAVDDITQNPFTILITGVDSHEGFAEVSRSDVNMLMTVNPKTHVILLTSIPRDYYLATACAPEDGCQDGAMDKLTHTGVHGVNTTKMTLEKALGITINYTIKVNFGTVISLVDAIGGIDVDVAPGYAVSTFNALPGFSVSEGINHLNGEQALAYSREREAYQEGDRQRGKNQQQVLTAIIQKVASPSILSRYGNLMDVLSGAFITDVDQKDIQSLVQYQLSVSPDWSILTYNLDGTGSTEFCAELGQAAYVMIPDQNTEKTAEEKIQAVLDGKSAEEVEAISASGSHTSAAPAESVSEEEEVVTDTTVPSEPVLFTGVDENGQTYYQDAVGQYYYWDENGNPIYFMTF